MDLYIIDKVIHMEKDGILVSVAPQQEKDKFVWVTENYAGISSCPLSALKEGYSLEKKDRIAEEVFLDEAFTSAI